ncbi:uncharacterized protein LOC106417342 [Brassica napus]|uniref:uncharacterized protein LOC106417342 n=1 Tax=Brassica napus TaxID=3708 RepID=UPI0020799D88|nr:uncharacterized protein LOC106417342 [Brassica napus]
MSSTTSSGLWKTRIELSNHKKEVDEIERLVFGTEIEQVEHLIVATAEAKIVEEADKMVEAKILKGDEPRAEKPVAKRADQKLKEVKLEDTTEVEQSPYDKLPFPQRVLTKAQKKVISKFGKYLSDIGLKLPAISGMREAHVQMMLIKNIVDHQAEVAELLNISTLKLDPPVTPKSLHKLESQGKFTLSCSLGKLTFDDALVDSGANTSSLTFGDFSSTTPIGLIKDFPLKIGSCTIPIDLTVLKMATEKRVPLILGTPFLTTVGACINFANKKVTLLNVNKAVSYPIQSPLDVEYCGTITCGDPSIEKIKDAVVVSKKESLDGESSKEICDEHLKSAKKKEVSRATKAAYDKKATRTHQLQDDPTKLQERLSLRSSPSLLKVGRILLLHFPFEVSLSTY